jgi:hypothetical protein
LVYYSGTEKAGAYVTFTTFLPTITTTTLPYVPPTYPQIIVQPLPKLEIVDWTKELEEGTKCIKKEASQKVSRKAILSFSLLSV